MKKEEALAPHTNRKDYLPGRAFPAKNGDRRIEVPRWQGYTQ